MLFRAFFSTENARRGWYKKDLSAENLIRDLHKKAPLTQYVRRGWHQKAQFKENAIDGTGIKKVPLTQYVRRGWREKSLSTENARLGWY